MPLITFKGKTYNSEFEMPQDVRQAYQKEQLRNASTTSLTDVVDIPSEVKAVYEQATKKVESSSSSSMDTSNLPTTEELYRQSAPQDMKHLPSDESVYRHSPPVIDPEHSTIEPDSGLVLKRLAVGVLCALAVIVIVYLVLLFLR